VIHDARAALTFPECGACKDWDQIVQRHKPTKMFDFVALTLEIRVQTLWPVYLTDAEMCRIPAIVLAKSG